MPTLSDPGTESTVRFGFTETFRGFLPGRRVLDRPVTGVASVARTAEQSRCMCQPVDDPCLTAAAWEVEFGDDAVGGPHLDRVSERGGCQNRDQGSVSLDQDCQALSAVLVTPERPAGSIGAGTLSHRRALDIHDVSEIGEVFSVENDRLRVVGSGRRYRDPRESDGQDVLLHCL